MSSTLIMGIVAAMDLLINVCSLFLIFTLGNVNAAIYMPYIIMNMHTLTVFLCIKVAA